MGSCELQAVRACQNEETIRTLQTLLEAARNGEIIGLAYTALHHGAEFSGEVVGHAKTKPIFVLGLLRALEEKVTRLIP